MSQARIAAFDEMNGQGGEVRGPHAEIARRLGDTPREQLYRKREEAEPLFRRIGITFAVYGEGGAAPGGGRSEMRR